MLTQAVLTDAILAMRSLYQAQGHSLYDIGNGLCDAFADDVLSYAVGPNWRQLEGTSNWQTLWSNELYVPIQGRDDTEHSTQWNWCLLQKEWQISPSLLEKIKLDACVRYNPAHCWIVLNKKHFDCDHPYGEMSPFEMLFFKRWTALMSPVALIDGETLYQRHYMAPLEKGAKPTLFDDFKYLEVNEMMHENHFVVEINGTLAGTLAIQTSPYDKTELWLKHVIVHENFRRQGLARDLLTALFEHARKTGQSIKRSIPSDMGAAYLPGIYDDLMPLYPDVTVIPANTY